VVRNGAALRIDASGVWQRRDQRPRAVLGHKPHLAVVRQHRRGVGLKATVGTCARTTRTKDTERTASILAHCCARAHARGSVGAALVLRPRHRAAAAALAGRDTTANPRRSPAANPTIPQVGAVGLERAQRAHRGTPRARQSGPGTPQQTPTRGAARAALHPTPLGLGTHLWPARYHLLAQQAMALLHPARCGTARRATAPTRRSSPQQRPSKRAEALPALSPPRGPTRADPRSPRHPWQPKAHPHPERAAARSRPTTGTLPGRRGPALVVLPFARGGCDGVGNHLLRLGAPTKAAPRAGVVLLTPAPCGAPHIAPRIVPCGARLCGQHRRGYPGVSMVSPGPTTRHAAPWGSGRRHTVGAAAPCVPPWRRAGGWVSHGADFHAVRMAVRVGRRCAPWVAHARPQGRGQGLAH
jgi:hypothetical protein